MGNMTSSALNPIFLNMSPYGLVKNETLEADLRSKGLEVFDFTIGDPTEPTAPFILEALKENLSNVSQYPSTTGLIELRTAGAEWLKRRFNIDLNPKSQIISSNGSKEAIFHIPHILISENSAKNTIVFPEPAYPVYKSGTILAGGKACEIPLKASSNFIFDIEDVPKEKLKDIAAVWVCYPHNPTGAQISKEQAEKIYKWALENEIILLSDECYVDMYFEEEKPISFLQVAEKYDYKNLLVFFSLSKRSGMTGYRTGFVAGDAHLISHFSRYRLNVGVGTPNFIQHAAVKAWADDEHVKDRNTIFSQKRKILEDFLNKNNFEYLKSSATFYIWATIPKGYESASEYCEALAKTTGIFATPGEAFGPNCKKYFRLALVPKLTELERCLAIWQTSINESKFK